MSWRSVLWPCELQEAVKQVLKKRDMTVSEICRELELLFKLKVPYQALNAILKVTRGVYTHAYVPSETTGKMVILYTLGILWGMKK